MAQMLEITKKIRARVVTLNEIQKFCNDSKIKFSVKKSVKKDVTTYVVVREYKDGAIQKSDAKTEQEIVPFLNDFIKHYNHC